MRLISLHDHLDQLMPNDIFIREVDKLDAFEIIEDMSRLL